MLWEIQTTVHSGTRDTSFNLTFETDAIIPVKGEINTPRVSHFDPNRNEDNICINLDLLEKAKKKPIYKQQQDRGKWPVL